MPLVKRMKCAKIIKSEEAMLFRKNGKYDYLIVGLGNIGDKYKNNRHNVGFRAIDRLIADCAPCIGKLKFHGEIFDCELEGKKCLVLKPHTFMNDSGRAVSAAASFYKIPVQNIIVIFDDISLPVGTIRLRKKGSAGGHNGVKDIIELLGSDDFPRIKIGVGAKPSPDYDLAKWVLSDIRREDLPLMEKALDNALRSLKLIVKGDFEKAQSSQNQ